MGHAGETVHLTRGEAGLKLRVEIWEGERDLEAIRGRKRPQIH